MSEEVSCLEQVSKAHFITNWLSWLPDCGSDVSSQLLTWCHTPHHDDYGLQPLAPHEAQSKCFLLYVVLVVVFCGSKRKVIKTVGLHILNKYFLLIPDLSPREGRRACMFIQKAIDKEKACHRGGKIFCGGFEHKMMAEFL